MLPFNYDYQVDLAVDNAHSRVIRLVGAGKHVLDLGCATGYVAKVLVEQFGCSVVGIEQDLDAAEQARKVCRQVIAGDLDALDFAAELGDTRFDVILCADVLEHLRDPNRVLAALRTLLVPDGYVVASIPNIGHVAVVAELLDGRFPYGPLGLLDQTHLRFFTRRSIHECFERVGLLVSHIERLRVEPEATEFRTDLSRFPPEFARLMRSHPDSTTYQFVLTAHPAPFPLATDAMREVLERTAAPANAARTEIVTASPFDAAEALFEAFLGRVTFLEAERDRLAREVGDARGRIDRLIREVDGHVSHAQNLEGEISRRDEQGRRTAQRLAESAEHVRGLERRLGVIEGSAGWQIVHRLRRWRLILFPLGSRRESVYRVVLGALLRGPEQRR